MKKKIVTGITMGEPAGVSSEITLKTWRNHRKKLDPFIFFGDPTHLLQTCTKLKFKVPIKIINEIVDDVILVDEPSIEYWMYRLKETENLIVEGAGAVTMAAISDLQYELKGKKVCALICGGNVV